MPKKNSVSGTVEKKFNVSEKTERTIRAVTRTDIAVQNHRPEISPSAFPKFLSVTEFVAGSILKILTLGVAAGASGAV